VDSDLVSSSLSSEDSDDEGGGSPAPRKSHAEKFDELFPYYLSLGMAEEQYWGKDSTLVVAYRKADKLRQERVNQDYWLQGAYFYEALCAVSPILHAFAKKGTKPKPYSSEPYSITEKKTELKEEETVKKSFEKGKRFMEKFLIDINKKFEEE
jgi:hypothetical protein